MPRSFSAIEIPRPLSERLTLLRAGLTGARWIDPENYHLTLRFIGDVDGSTAHEFAEALGGIEMPPFELKLNGLGSFGGHKPRAIFAGIAPSDGLDALRRANERAARGAGLPPRRSQLQAACHLGAAPQRARRRGRGLSRAPGRHRCRALHREPLRALFLAEFGRRRPLRRRGRLPARGLGQTTLNHPVMAGLVPAIHDFHSAQDVDARRQARGMTI